MNELILCIQKSGISKALEPKGFTRVHDEGLSEILDMRAIWFGPRAVLEQSSQFRQLIPYVILRCGSAVATFCRGNGSTEGRLHGLSSIGFGGHVNIADAVIEGVNVNVMQTLRRATAREMKEEVIVAEPTSKELLGVIYSDRTAVDQVHLGIVEMWTIPSTEIASAEPHLGEVEFVEIAALSSISRWESWSRYCVDAMAETVERNSAVMCADGSGKAPSP